MATVLSNTSCTVLSHSKLNSIGGVIDIKGAVPPWTQDGQKSETGDSEQTAYAEGQESDAESSDIEMGIPPDKQLPEKLHADGYVVRNTFIHDPNGAVDAGSRFLQGSVRRSHSAPAVQLKRRARRGSASIHSSIPNSPTGSSLSNDYAHTSSSEELHKKLDDAGIGFRKDGHEDMQGDAMKAYHDAADDFVKAVLDHCRFLRISGHGLIFKHPNKQCNQKEENADSADLMACLRFYVHGLPWSKRSKWIRPLLWSIAVILERNGYPVQMRGGKLTVGGDGSPLLRLDFSAHRREPPPE